MTADDLASWAITVSAWAMIVSVFLSAVWFFLTQPRHRNARQYRDRILAQDAADTEREAAQDAEKRREQIITAGVNDVLKGWFIWAADAVDFEARNTERLRTEAEYLVHGGMDPESAAKTAWHGDTVRRRNAVSNLDRLLSNIPDDTWDTHALQTHAYAVLECVGLAGDLPDAHDRLCLVAAMIADRRDDVFDVETAPPTDRYVYAEDPQDQALYLRGRGIGVERILEAHTAARLHLDRVRAAREAVRAANQRHTAALKGIRETYDPTTARDQHTDWDRQIHSIEGNDTP